MESKVPFTLKDTITVVASIAILIGLYKLFQLLGVVSTSDERKEAKEKKQTEKIENKEQKKEEKELIKEGIKLSFQKSYYRRTIDEIIEMLDGAENPLTEYDVANLVIKSANNKLDINELNQAFGKYRDVENIGFGSTTYYSLKSLLKDQLDAGTSTSSGLFSTYDLVVSGLKKKGLSL